VPVDRAAATAWLDAVAAAEASPGGFELSDTLGIGGHGLALLDFDPAQIAHLRQIGRLIAVPSGDGLATALAIAGSAAQGRIQPFPADLDFFERVHITESTREEACAALAEAVRTNVARVQAHRDFTLRDVHFGAVPPELRQTGTTGSRGALVWRLADVLAGELALTRADGTPRRVDWGTAAADPGFVKLEWLVRVPGSRSQETIAVSKVIDPTWRTPTGATVSLDGLLDADYQQIYLEPAAADLTAGLVADRLASDRVSYLEQMEREICRFTRAQPPNYVKVAKRLYNVCRLSGHYEAALFVRELFHESEARAHQIAARLDRIAAWERDGDLLACAELAACLPELAPLIAPTGAAAEALHACEEALAAGRATALRAALAVLIAALNDDASDAVARRLRAFPATRSLLDEIVARHGQALAEGRQ